MMMDAVDADAHRDDAVSFRMTGGGEAFEINVVLVVVVVVLLYLGHFLISRWRDSDTA